MKRKLGPLSASPDVCFRRGNSDSIETPERFQENFVKKINSKKKFFQFFFQIYETIIETGCPRSRQIVFNRTKLFSEGLGKLEWGEQISYENYTCDYLEPWKEDWSIAPHCWIPGLFFFLILL